MIYKLKDGTVIKGQFEYNGIKYPSNWLELSTQENRTALGITKSAEQVDTIVQPAEYVPTQEALFSNIKYKLQQAIDNKAISLEFSDGNSLMLYASVPNAFQQLAIKFLTWEASVWEQAAAYKAKIIAGTKPMLTPEEAVAMMPVY